MAGEFDDLLPGPGGYTPPPPKTTGAFDDLLPKPPKAEEQGNEFTHQLGQAARIGVNTLSGIPLAAMDFGVGARNLIGHLTGTQEDFQYPSDAARGAEDRYLGKPRGLIENLTQIAGPMVVGAGLSAAPSAAESAGANSSLVSGLRSFGNAVNATPEAGSTLGGMGGPPSQTPAGFVSLKDQKAQQTAALLQKLQPAGAVVPPSSSNPTLGNWALETAAGKIATQQDASTANAAAATRDIAARDFKLNPDAPLTLGALRSIRKSAGDAYQAVRSTGMVSGDSQLVDDLSNLRAQFGGVGESFEGTPESGAVKEIDAILNKAPEPSIVGQTGGELGEFSMQPGAPQFDANHLVTKVQMLRDKADAAFNSGEGGLGTAYKAVSTSLDDLLSRNLQGRMGAGDPSAPPALVNNYLAARQTIAKAHAVEDALNESTHQVDLQALARQLDNNEPLSGATRDWATLAQSFRKATQDPSKFGSKGVSHLDSIPALALGMIAEHATDNPWAMGLGLAYPAARLGARSYLGSAMGQRGAIPSVLSGIGPSTAKAAALAHALATQRPSD